MVEESRNPGFSKGDIVQGLLGWQQYSLSDGAGLAKLPKGLPVPLTAFFGPAGPHRSDGLFRAYWTSPTRSPARRW